MKKMFKIFREFNHADQQLQITKQKTHSKSAKSLALQTDSKEDLQELISKIAK